MSPSTPDWRGPWLRINLLIPDLTKLYRVREARDVLKVEMNRAIATKAAMKAAAGWWS